MSSRCSLVTEITPCACLTLANVSCVDPVLSRPTTPTTESYRRTQLSPRFIDGTRGASGSSVQGPRNQRSGHSPVLTPDVKFFEMSPESVAFAERFARTRTTCKTLGLPI